MRIITAVFCLIFVCSVAAQDEQQDEPRPITINIPENAILIDLEPVIANEQEIGIQLENLEQQTVMATWTQMLFWPAGLGTVIAAVALWFLSRTVRYTRDAAEAARATLMVAESTLAANQSKAETELRAYVVCESVKVKDVIERGGVSYIVLQLGWQNVGSTPARKIDTGFKVEYDMLNGYDIGRTFDDVTWSEVADLGKGQIVFQNYTLVRDNKYVKRVPPTQNDGIDAVVQCFLRYSDVFSREYVNIRTMLTLAEWTADADGNFLSGSVQTSVDRLPNGEYQVDA